MFLNIGFVLELILENGHQDLKRAVLGSNYNNRQLQAMYSTLSNDCKNRIAYETMHVHNKLGTEEMCFLLQLMDRSGDFTLSSN